MQGKIQRYSVHWKRTINKKFNVFYSKTALATLTKQNMIVLIQTVMFIQNTKLLSQFSWGRNIWNSWLTLEDCWHLDYVIFKETSWKRCVSSYSYHNGFKYFLKEHSFSCKLIFMIQFLRWCLNTHIKVALKCLEFYFNDIFDWCENKLFESNCARSGQLLKQNAF